MRKIWLSFLLLIFLLNQGAGQTMKAYLEAAEKAVTEGNHYAALLYFDEALQFDTNRIDLLYRSAEAARSFNAYRIAAEKYKKVKERETNAEYPLASFWRASMLQRLGDYENASLEYSLYLSEHEGEDEYYTSRAKKEKEAVDWAIVGAPSPYRSIDLQHLDGSVNTPYSEFGALSTENILYYSSLRYTKENDKQYPKRLVSKILQKGEEDPEGKPIDGPINAMDVHSAHTTFSLDGTRLYYTICDYHTDDSIVCQIYFRRIENDSLVGDAIRLPDYINVDSATATQPHIGYDPFLKKEVLYYVSDKKGGKGKKDIYYSVIDASGNFSQPIALDTINTVEDEMSPFFHEPTKTLFFSSEGYNGYGGLDIYSVKQTENGWGRVENLGTPINSSFHDVYYVLSEDQRTGYLSSNRIGSYYLDDQQEACCFDIYKADIEPCDLHLKLMVFDAITNEPIYNCTATLSNLSDQELASMLPEKDGKSFVKELDCNKDYKVLVDKFGYYPDSISFSTADIGEVDTLVKRVYLYPSHLDLEILTYDKNTLKDLEGVKIRIVDLTDTTAPEMVYANLDSNVFNFKVEKGKQYRIYASRENFSPLYLDIATPSERTVNDTILKKLYLVPAGFLKWLPLAIYFDNDQPDPRSWSTMTKQFYTNTFDPYYAKKDSFMVWYADGLEGENRRIAEQAVGDFFDSKLQKGNREYLNLLEELYTLLEQGMTFEIVVTGYASPRASSAYNNVLSQRRYDAVRNEVFAYKRTEEGGRGPLWDYYKKGALKIKWVSRGEQDAPKSVSDDLNDERNSIYSPEASAERRVEIIEVKKISN